jgi:hypothetical protein
MIEPLHIQAMSTVQFALSMVAIIVIDCWYRSRHE